MLFIRPSADGHFGWFPFPHVVNNTAVDIVYKFYMNTHFPFSWGMT